jgi:hypothetical protein
VTLRSDLQAAQDEVKTIPGLRTERDDLRTKWTDLVKRPDKAFGTYRSTANHRDCWLLPDPDRPDRVKIINEYHGLLPEENTKEIGHWDPESRGFVFPKGSICFWVEPKGTQRGCDFFGTPVDFAE